MRRNERGGYRLRLLLAVGLVFPGSAGCQEQGVAIQVDREFIQKVKAAHDGGRTLYLRQATEFSWDEVYFFSQPVTGKQIRDVIGQSPMADEDVYWVHDAAPLMVFSKDGRIVRALGMQANLITFPDPGRGRVRWNSDVRLAPRGSHLLEPVQGS
jgi:hypothetical protein